MFTEADVRRCVFANLHERFDTYLAQAENLRALFAALNETEFEVRELAIQITGRLCTINPAFIMPVLRKCLINVSSVAILVLCVGGGGMSGVQMLDQCEWSCI